MVVDFLMNKKTLKIFNRILAKAGLQLARVRPDVIFKSQFVHDPQYSYLLNPMLQDRLNDELAKKARAFFFNQLPGLISDDFITLERVRQFFQIWGRRPYYDNTGGSGFHNAFWLYLITAGLQPDLIVESGVWKGHASWLFKQAAPESEIHGFDISLKRLEFTHSEVTFYEQDWGEFQFTSPSLERSLVFFDCHVNHAQRILEAKNKGFKHLLFDDNPPLPKIYSYGQPGFPTAHMLWDGDITSEDPVLWMWKGKPHQESLDANQAWKARDLIKKHIVFPDVGGPTRYGGFSFLTYVEI
jgi:hypothetical protein